MLVRFIHPATREVTEATLSPRCPSCIGAFEPREAEQQKNVGDAIEVRCPRCDVVALQWSPPALPTVDAPASEGELAAEIDAEIDAEFDQVDDEPEPELDQVDDELDE